MSTSTWADVAVIHEAARAALNGKRGRQRAIGSSTKSRGKVWRERAAQIATMTGSIGAGGPSFTPTGAPIMDPEYLLARNILREANDAHRGKARPAASVHEDVPAVARAARVP